MDNFVFHDRAALQGMGEQVRDLAIAVTMKHDDDYGLAQQQANNYPNQVGTGVRPPLDGYTPPSSGPDDSSGNVRRFVSAEYADIPQFFTNFAIIDPGSIQYAIDDLYRTAATLEPDLKVELKDGQGHSKLYLPVTLGGAAARPPVRDVVNAMNVRLADWHGPAGDAVKIYLGKYDVASQLQRQLTISLAVTLQAQMEIRQRMLTDVWSIGENTIKALNKVNNNYCPDNANVGTVLTIVGAIGAVLLAIPTDGLSLAVEGLQSAGSILGARSSATLQKTIGGHTVPQVLLSMIDAGREVMKSVNEQQADLVSCLNSLQNELGKIMSVVQLPPPTGVNDLRTAGIDTLHKTFTD